MTTATLATGNRTMDTAVRPRRSLEELVDRLIETLFPAQTEAAESSATRSIHEARRLRQAGDIDGALTALGNLDVERATPREARWAFSEWKQMATRRSGDRDAWSTPRAPGGPPRWFPTATGRSRSPPSWGCAGGPARSSPGAACGGFGRWEGLALDPGLITPSGDGDGAASPARPLRLLAFARTGRARRQAAARRPTLHGGACTLRSLLAGPAPASPIPLSPTREDLCPIHDGA